MSNAAALTVQHESQRRRQPTREDKKNYPFKRNPVFVSFAVSRTPRNGFNSIRCTAYNNNNNKKICIMLVQDTNTLYFIQYR